MSSVPYERLKRQNFQITTIIQKPAKNNLLFMLVDKFTEISFHPDIVNNHEINFTKYFYKYKPRRPIEEIRSDILALEGETEGLLQEIVE